MFKRRLFPALFLVGFHAVAPAWGQGPDASKGRPLPDFDARELAASDQPAGGQQAQAKALVERRRANIESFLAAEIAANPGTRIVPNRFGVPKLFLRDGKSLSAPSTQEPEEIARSFLRAHTAIFPFAAAEADTLRLLVKDVTAGATYLAFNQTVGGIDVFNAQIKFTIGKAGEVAQVAAGDVAPGLSLSATPALSPEEAVRAAYAAISLAAPAALSRAPDANGKVAFLNPRGDRSSAITAELSVFPLTAASARLAYRIFLEVDAETWYEMLIDAGDGGLLFRHNLYVSAGQARVWAQSPMVGSYDLVALPDGWLPAGGTVTTGNNTDAFLDANGNDKADTTTDPNMQNGRAYSASQFFDFPFGDGTLALDPRKYQPAAVTNLFYLINSAHDYYYGLGFTEAAGNFQTDNFGKGGTGNDAVLAEAQQASESNNASFAPTPEGIAPRIRMGLFTRSTSSLTDDLDSDYDGEVVFHEYGHGVSNRLVGALTSTSCLNKIQSGGMGEGWSDYFSISFYDNPVEGAYIAQNATRGVRRQSYEGYTYTYEDIGNAGYEVHNDGEIWAATLWDLRKSLGQAATDLLVIDGLKSTPCNPSMTDARDAILSADQAVNGGANRAVIWQMFAKHGMGYSALGVDGDDATGTRYDAAYDQPPDLQTAKNPAIASNPLSVATGMGDAYAYQVIASNPNGGVLNYALGSRPAGMAVDSATGSVSWTATFLGQRVKIAVTDGKDGKVVHGYYLPVNTLLGDGAPIVIGEPGGTAGYASVAVPAGVPVLQVTLRNGTGDADLYVTAPDGSSYYSGEHGDNETVSLANPKAGIWQIEVDGYSKYSGVSLAAAMVTPASLSPDATVSGLSGVIGSETLYRVTIPAGASLFSVSTSGGTGDVNIYLRKGQPAVCQVSSYVGEPCLYDSRSVKVGNADSISLASPAAADWYLDLSGYAAYSGVTLVTSTASVSIATSSPLASGVAGVAYFQSIGATGGVLPYTWSVASGSLPGGLTLDSAGTISGTPTAPGSFGFTIQVKDGASAAATAVFNLTIAPSGTLAITTSSTLPSGSAGSAYSQTLAATGGTAPYTWSVASGSLPDGLAIGGDGALSGTPTAAGSSSFTVQVRDSVSATATRTFTLTVGAASLSIVTASPLPLGVTGLAYSQALVATGGVSPYTWSVTSGALPGGLTIGASGTISGTPTTAGSFSFTVQVKDSAAATASAALALTIVSPPSPLSIVTASPLLSGFANGAYSQTLGATGGSAPYTWSVASGALPGGLTLSSGGTIAGTPSAAGTFNFTVQVRDSNSATATKPFALTVMPLAGPLARVGVLSQFAAGGSWDTTIWVINSSSAAVPVRLVFHGDDGTQVLKTSDGTTVDVPLTITQQGDSQVQTLTTLDRVLNPNTTLVVGGGLGLASNVEGWVDVIGTSAVSGFAVFRYAPGGLAQDAPGFVTPWEGTVPLQSQLSASTMTLPFDNTNGFTTGIAIGSLSSSAATITATFFDIDGNALGAPQTISFAANGHTAFMVNPGPNNQDWSFTAGQQGIVKFTGAPMMGLGLRASPYGTLTSVPTVLQ